MIGDRNLLFAILALQQQKINSRQFIEACNSWCSAKQTPLPDIMIELGYLNDVERSAIDAAADEYLARNDEDVLQTISTIAGSGARNALRDIDDFEILQTLSYLAPADGYVQLGKLDLGLEPQSRYTRTRVHGRGGIGNVWLAHDECLNRDVALKELRSDKHFSDEARRHFVKEAQITSQLEHPNIVPVYEVARKPDSEDPFYAMRFVRGRTLKQSIREYHQSREQGDGDAMALRKLLGALIGVCNAMAYSHSRGVVHRDLKPGNVMLGPFGEVMVLDWGMAKVVDQEDESLEEISLSTNAQTEPTLAGRVMGTPAYMAPEQADGNSRIIDARTDVYGLGSILFSILTGEHPHSGDSTEQLLSRIVQGMTPRPRDLAPHIPLALDAICAKAMSNKRIDRYQTAAALADDIQNYLADEPVECYPERWSERSMRWMRKHRTWTQAIGASMLFVTIVSLLALATVQRARRAEQIALMEATKSRAIAIHWLQESRNTVDKSVFGVVELLRNYPGTHDLCMGLLEDAVADYRRFATRDYADPELRVQSAMTYVRLGDLHSEMGDDENAMKAYRNALSRLIRVVDDHGNPANLQSELAATRGKLASTYAALGMAEDSDKVFASAMADLDRLIRTDPDDRLLIRRRAEIRMNRGQVFYNLENDAKAFEDLNAANEELAKLCELDESPANREQYASALSMRGQILYAMQNFESAAEDLQESLILLNELCDEAPDHPPYLEKRSDCRVTLANVWRSRGEHDLEVQMYEQTIRDYNALHNARPGIPAYREKRSLTRTNLAQALHAMGRNQRLGAEDHRSNALDEIRTAIEEQYHLIDEYRNEHRYREHAAISTLTIGRVLVDLNVDHEATDKFDELVKVFNTWSESSKSPFHFRLLGTTHSNRARILRKAGKHPEAATEFQSAINAYTSAKKLNGNDHRTLDGLAWAHQNLGEVYSAIGRLDDAKAAFKQAINLRTTIGNNSENLNALSLLLSECEIEGIRNTAEAIRLAILICGRQPENPVYQTTLGIAYYHADMWPLAAAALGLAAEYRGRTNGYDQFYAAMTYAKMKDHPKARLHFDKAVKAMEQQRPGHVELLRLREQAKRVMGDR